MTFKKSLLFLSIIAAYCILAGGSGEQSEEDKRRADNIMAKIMCEGFVEKRLKSPSSADFAGAFDGVKGANHINSDEKFHYFEMKSWVDAQNSFGAKIRTNFYCKIKNEIGTDQWVLIKLKM